MCPEHDSPLVFVIILNWNRPDDTLTCLEKLQQSAYTPLHIVVVDNASGNFAPQRIRSDFPEVTLIENSQNLGYAGGNNVGIEYALAHGADYIILLNDDAYVLPDTIQHMVAAAGEPDVAAVGCKVRIYETPERLWAAGEGFSRSGAWPLDDGSFDQPGEVKFAVGCCILMRSQALREIGPLETDFFAYFEEMEWCYRARDAGYRILYTPQAVIYHKLGHSASGTRSPVYHYLNTRNWLYFWERRGEIPTNWRRAIYMLVVWWHEVKFVVHEGSHKKARTIAVTRGAWDYLRKHFGPPPANLLN